MTGKPIAQDFDIRFNKNAFALMISGATNAIPMPGPGQSSYGVMACTINKNNLDGKNPPKNPFMVQVAMKTAVDVFYFDIPCMLHCLVNHSKPVSEAEYATNWQKIKDTNQL